MNNSERLRLLNAYLNILFDACRKHQYERVRMLLDGAIYDAEQSAYLDQRLIWIISELSDHYASHNLSAEAQSTLELIRTLKQKIGSSDHSKDTWFQETALTQMMSMIQTSKSDSHHNLFSAVKLHFCDLFRLGIQASRPGHASA
ncbi:MAG TPA: hypothetical protein V6C97_14900 [Oculatellaceae cyanobacterium]